jgi:hypothetical protein
MIQTDGIGTDACRQGRRGLLNMTVMALAAPLAAAVAMALATGVSGAAVAAESAADLMARVIARQQTSGFTMRARLIVQPADNSKPPVILQIRAIGKQDATSSRVLYQALWPDAVKGRAVIVERANRQPIGGFFFVPPDTMTPITSAHLTDAVLDSDLTVEDLAEQFQWWPNPVFAGQDKVRGQACRVVESRPPGWAQSSYPLLRSCVSESKVLILRVEKIDADGRVVKRFTVTRTARTETGVVAPRMIEIQNLAGGRTTTVDISRGERDIIVSSKEFTLARLKSLGR